MQTSLALLDKRFSKLQNKGKAVKILLFNRWIQKEFNYKNNFAIMDLI